MSASQKELASFKNGTKRGASIYPILKSEQHYDSFHRAFHANAKAQDPKLKPQDHDLFAPELVDDQQSFMYSILVTILQTECGRELTKEFEGDAQKLLEKMHIYCTQTQNEILDLTTQITNLTSEGVKTEWKICLQNCL